MKHGDSTRINKLDRMHLEYVQTRIELNEKLEEIKNLRIKLNKLDKQIHKIGSKNE